MPIIKAKENLSKYFQKRAANIEAILSIAPEKFEKREYHKLRVEIKKLSAILDINNYCHPDFQKDKCFKPFKKIFIHSGKIRGLQLEETLLRKYNTLTIQKFLNKVQRAIKKEKKYFKLLVQEKQKRKIESVFNEIVFYLDGITDNKVNEFIEIKKKEILNLVGENPIEPVNLHELRKAIKRILYSNESIHLRDKNKYKKEDQFQELLGNWHDSKMLSQRLEKSIIKKKINTDELRQLLQIDAELNAKRRELYNQINNTLMTKDLFV